MPNDDLCTTCSSDNYFREMSFTQELPEIKYCNNCHQLEHDQVTDCPAFNYENATFNGILTLGQFRQFTQHLSDDTQIVTDDQNDWYWNIKSVQLPDQENYFAITLNTANDFDPRQF